MFVLVEMVDTVRIPPWQFERKLNDSIAEELNKKLANKVLGPRVAGQCPDRSRCLSGRPLFQPWPCTLNVTSCQGFFPSLPYEPDLDVSVYPRE